MRDQPDSRDFILNSEIETLIKNDLTEHYKKDYPNVNSYVDMLMDIGGFRERFQYFLSTISDGKDRRNENFLCSGFSAGGEMIAAREFQFTKIHGVEVDPFLVDIAKKRLDYLQDMFPILYDGDSLPYNDEMFGVIFSGHVIEHTRDPFLYIKECMRTLAVNGMFFLEFPHRYHRIELHTNLYSFEWLPRTLRNTIIKIISSRYSPLAESIKRRYESIVTTGLQQISLNDIRKMLKNTGYRWVLINSVEAAPGIIRCVIKKEPSLV